jgi:hypothetical protein
LLFTAFLDTIDNCEICAFFPSFSKVVNIFGIMEQERGDQKRNRQAGVLTMRQGEGMAKQRDKTYRIET